jgi:hypothetical protein
MYRFYWRYYKTNILGAKWKFFTRDKLFLGLNELKWANKGTRIRCHRVALVRTDDSEERIASIIGVTKFGEVGTTLAATTNRRTLRRNTLCYVDIVFLCSVRRLVITASVVPSPPILVTLMMEAIRSSELMVVTRATWRNIEEDDILHSPPWKPQIWQRVR